MPARASPLLVATNTGPPLSPRQVIAGPGPAWNVDRETPDTINVPSRFSPSVPSSTAVAPKPTARTVWPGVSVSVTVAGAGIGVTGAGSASRRSARSNAALSPSQPGWGEAEPASTNAPVGAVSACPKKTSNPPYVPAPRTQ